MLTISEKKLRSLIERWESLQSLMADAAEKEDYIKLAKEFSELDSIIPNIKDLMLSLQEKQELLELIDDDSIEIEMQQMAKDEIPHIEEKIKELEKNIKVFLIPKDLADQKNVILELRAGTGGDEAAIFTGDLFRMYNKFAESKGWKMQIISANDAAMGGYKEIIANISGQNAFASLKYESGVHRVQRIPDTESGGEFILLHLQLQYCQKPKNLM